MPTMTDESPMFKIGDEVTINGMYDDGTHEANDTPPEQYDNKPLQRWRVVYVGPEGVRLHVLSDDPQRDAFNNEIGEFWIRRS